MSYQTKTFESNRNNWNNPDNILEELIVELKTTGRIKDESEKSALDKLNIKDPNELWSMIEEKMENQKPTKIGSPIGIEERKNLAWNPTKPGTGLSGNIQSSTNGWNRIPVTEEPNKANSQFTEEPIKENSSGFEFVFGVPLWHIKKELPQGADEWALNVIRNSPPMNNSSSKRGYQSQSTRDWKSVPEQFTKHLQSCLHNFPLFKFDNWCINLHNKGNYNTAHTHKGVDLVGIWYLTDNHGTTFLHHPSSHLRDKLIKLLPDHNKSITDHDGINGMFINATAGDILLFPSDIVHEVKEHMYDNPRISLSFNLILPTSGDEVKFLNMQDELIEVGKVMEKKQQYNG